ncbi:MAG: uracil-DNA glycosylase [Deltaproteobacteria bacterium]|nr:uracil-DNA glycosylase [Deltaproteobacteria bacterium]
MDSHIELQEELLQLISSLRRFIQFEKDTKGHCPGMFLRGDVAHHSTTFEEIHEDDEISYDTAVTLDDVRRELGDCRRCGLYQGRKNIVFGEGNHTAELVFVGEAPGQQEDIQGNPFVGRAGQLLTRIIEAMGLARKDVYICNILKCRPPGNRNPKPDEISVCEPFLIKQLEIIQPKVICALGTFAARTLLKTDVPISLLRGKFHLYQGIKLMPTYHPAYLLRNPGAKKQVWEDVQMIMKELKEGIGSRDSG